MLSRGLTNVRSGLSGLVLASGLLLSACGQQSNVSRKDRPSANTSAVTLPPVSVQLTLDHTTPLDSVGLAAAIVDDPAGINALGRITGANARLLFDASSRAGAECMKGAGYADFPVDSFQPAPEYSPATRAANEGYLLPGTSRAAGSASPPRSARDAWLADHPSAQKAWGEEGAAAGCVVEVYSIIYGSKSGPFDAWKRFNLTTDTWNTATRESAELGAVDAAWSTCMAEQGVEAAKPSSLWARRWPGTTPGPDEIATRSADLQCRTDVNYSGRRAAAVAPLLDSWLAENREVVNETRAAIDQWLSNARATLKSE